VLVSAVAATSRCRRRGRMMSLTYVPSGEVAVMVGGVIAREKEVGERLLAVCLAGWESRQLVCHWGTSLADWVIWAPACGRQSPLLLVCKGEPGVPNK
jgi:hypothetical protein